MNMERKLTEKYESLAEAYTSPKHPYAKYMKVLEAGPVAKARGLAPSDYANLGKQLDKWHEWLAIREANGDQTSLGVLPKIALDALTVNVAASPISAIAAVQPIEEQQGIVYFNQFVAQNTRGNVTAGQTLFDALQVPQAFPNGYASDSFFNSTIYSNASPGVATLTNVALTSEDFGSPINPNTITLAGSVVFSAGTCVFANMTPDVVTGAFSQVVQAGTSGTYHSVHGVVNYDAGTVTMTFDATPSGQTTITASFQTVEESGSDLQNAIIEMASKPILAQTFGLKSSFGIQEAFIMKKRFGSSMEEQTAKNIAAAINQEIVNRGVGIVSANVPGSNGVTVVRQPQSGVSLFEHQMAILNALADADAQLVTSAGRGNVNCWIAGVKAAAILSMLPGYKAISNDSTFGPHICGTLNGVTVVKIPFNSVLDANTILGVYRGMDNFESPLVYAPFMPLIITEVLQNGVNPLARQRAGVHMAGLAPMVTSLTTSVTIDQTSFNYGGA